MFQRSIFCACLIILGVVYGLSFEGKPEPIELFHYCVEPENDGNEPDKSPVLLIHGIFGTHKFYEGLDQLIAKRTKRKVCAVDLRNHGDSPWNDRFDVIALTADISHFLDKQNIKRVNIIGESLGGKVAIHFTLNNPDRVDSLIVEDIRPNSIKHVIFMSVRVAIQVFKRMVDSQPENMNETEAYKWFNQYAKDIFEKMGDQQIPENFSQLMGLRLVNGKWQLKQNLDVIYEHLKKVWTESTGLYTGPVLFVYGTKSPFQVGDDEDNILKLFPNVKMVPLEGAGHTIHLFHREFDDIAVNFLNEVH